MRVECSSPGMTRAAWDCPQEPQEPLLLSSENTGPKTVLHHSFLPLHPFPKVCQVLRGKRDQPPEPLQGVWDSL